MSFEEFYFIMSFEVKCDKATKFFKNEIFFSEMASPKKLIFEFKIVLAKFETTHKNEMLYI
jgi:hypothetical protein